MVSTINKAVDEDGINVSNLTYLPYTNINTSTSIQTISLRSYLTATLLKLAYHLVSPPPLACIKPKSSFTIDDLYMRYAPLKAIKSTSPTQ